MHLVLPGRRRERHSAQVSTQGFRLAAEPPEAWGSPVLASCLPTPSLPSPPPPTPPRAGSWWPLWSLANLPYQPHAQCFITTPGCFVRFSCFVSIKKAALEMLSFDYPACLHALGREGCPPWPQQTWNQVCLRAEQPVSLQGVGSSQSILKDQESSHGIHSAFQFDK